MAQNTTDQDLLLKAQILEAIQRISLAQTPQALLETFKDIAVIKNSTRTVMIIFLPAADLSIKRARVEAVIDSRPEAVDSTGIIYTPEMAPLFWLADPTEAFIIENLDSDQRLNEQSRNILRRLGAQSLLAFGLIVAEAHIGWLLVENESPRSYSDDEIDFLQQLTRHLAGAVQNHRLMAHTQQRARQIQTGAEISRITSSILNQDELIHKAVNLIKKGFDFYYVGLFLIDSQKQWATLQAGSGEEGRVQVEARHRLALNEQSMIGWCITHKEARIALDVGEDAAHFNNPHLPLTRSEMALPLISQESVIGALTVQSVKSAAFSADDIATLQIMADQLANAIVNSQLYQRSQQTARELEILLETNRDLSASTDLDKLLELIIHRATNIVDGDHGTIFLAEGNLLIPRAVFGDYAKEMLAVRVPIGHGLSGAAAQTRQSLKHVVVRPDEDQQTSVPDTPSVPEALVAVPIQTDSNLIGVLLIRRFDIDKAFSDDEVKLLEGIGQQAAIAVENANLLAATQKTRQQYLAMVDNIPGAVYRAELGETRSLTYVSDDLFDITGYPVERFYGDGDLSIADLIHPEDRGRIVHTIRQQIKLRQPYEIQYKIISQDGQLKYVLDQGRGMFAEEDRLLYVDGIIFNVTERVLLEQAVERRATQFEAVAQVGQKASAILDVDRLLEGTVNLISDTFDFYYAAIFLLDKNEEWAVFRAGSGLAGEKLLAKGHRLRKDEDSMVGWAACRGEARVSLKARLEDHRYDNPDLPLTRSEVALPLISRGKVIGALDAQSVEENAFEKEDIDTLQVMANQLANVIENARFFKATQSNLYHANLLYNTTRTLMKARTEDRLFKSFVVAASRVDVDTVSVNLYGGPPEDRYFEVKEIWDSRDSVINPVGTRLGVKDSTLSILFYQNETVFIEDTKTDPRLADPSGQAVAKAGVHSIIGLPIVLHGQNQGIVVISSKNSDKKFGTEEVRFFESLVQQLTITWQNLRLLKETEQRLRRERIIRQITGNIHAAVGIENILQTTVTELSNALDTSGGIARLGADNELKVSRG